MAEKITKTIAYLASSLNTLSDLQSSCNRDESYLGKVINIELATIDTQSGAKAVGITYEKVPLSSKINLGHLTLSSFEDEADANLKTAEFLLAQATPVLPGNSPVANKSRAKAFIQNNTEQFLIFRDKKLS